MRHPPKFGETFRVKSMATPSQALVIQGRCREQTRGTPPCNDEGVGVLRPTNRENLATKVVAGMNHQMPVRFWHGAPNFIFFGSSVVEHISHKDDVIGSIPIQRTINLFYGGVSGIGYGLACKVMLCAFKSHLRLQFWLVSSVPTFKVLRSIRRLCGVPCEGNARL